MFQRNTKTNNMIYTTTSDPSDGFSNHWSNAPDDHDCCPECGREANLMEDHYYCKFCNEAFNYFDENGEFINE